MDLQFLIAIFLPIALPPTVSEDTNPAINAPSNAVSRLGLFSRILKTIAAPIAPLIIPQISPTTSLQKLDALSAFFKSPTASFAPFILLAAMEFTGTTGHAVIATPIMSNRTPIDIINTSMIKEVIILALIIKVSEIKLKIIAKRNVKKVMMIIQFLILFLDFFIFAK